MIDDYELGWDLAACDRATDQPYDAGFAVDAAPEVSAGYRDAWGAHGPELAAHRCVDNRGWIGGSYPWECLVCGRRLSQLDVDEASP